jgi:hypothetical protein
MSRFACATFRPAPRMRRAPLRATRRALRAILRPARRVRRATRRATRLVLRADLLAFRFALAIRLLLELRVRTIADKSGVCNDSLCEGTGKSL